MFSVLGEKAASRCCLEYKPALYANLIEIVRVRMKELHRFEGYYLRTARGAEDRKCSIFLSRNRKFRWYLCLRLLWKNWKPISTSRPSRRTIPFASQTDFISSRGGEEEEEKEKDIFLKRAANVYAFSRGGLRWGKTAASRLEFTGNNTGARARGDSSRAEPPRVYAAR